MAEYTAIPVQTIAAGQNAVFNNTSCQCSCNNGVVHRQGSGQFLLTSGCNSCGTEYLITYNANIAVNANETPGQISVALALNGEQLGGTVGMAQPAAVGNYFNVSAQTTVFVPKCADVTISVKNTSAIAIDMQNLTVTISRVCTKCKGA